MSKKPNATATTADSICIDSSSDEEADGADKANKNNNSMQPDRVTVTRIASNGAKTTTTTEELSSIINKPTYNKPGPASQKRRRLDTIDEMDNKNSSAQQQQQQAQLSSGSKPKRFKKEVYAKKSNVTFADVGGMDKSLKELCELVMHVKHPELYRHIGLPPPRGFLLHGPIGCGKSLLAHAIAGQLDILLVEVPATELIAGVSGESEERIREIFEQAASFAPCVLFVDEIDAISSNRQTAQKDMERRIVAQLLSSIDNLSKMKFGDQVLVIGATNRADSLDPALRRVGRFDHEISLGIPDRPARAQILEIISKNLKLKRPFDFDELAALTPGYVGADLLALAMRAASTAIKRAISEREQKMLNEKDHNESCHIVEPSIVSLDDELLMDVDNNDKGVAKNEDSQMQAPVEENDVKNDVEKSDEMKTNEHENRPVENVENGEKTSDDVSSTVESSQTAAATTTKTTTSVSESQVMETEDLPEVQDKNKNEDKAVETLNDVICSKPELKLQVSLENMLKWLRNDIKPIADDELESLAITRDDFLDAVKHVQPSAKREGFITVPDVTWDDIGSLQDIRSELKLAVLAPVKFPEKLQLLGIQSPSGVLLCGPPGL
jgi:ribosome biogenesis ATPase